MNKILWDCHMHSSFSSDSPTPMENMIKEAISKKMAGIIFTEHQDTDYPASPDGLSFTVDLDSYMDCLLRLKEEYRTQLDIRFGIELGLQPHLSEQYHLLLEQYPFDFVIGSSHLVHGADPYYADFYLGRSEEDCYREYFQSILENLEAFDGMDVYGHIDYIVRYGPNKNRNYSYEKYQDILDAILKKIISMGKGIELNTGGYHYGLGEPNPCTEIIRRYRELGGEIITVGADAHTPDKIGYDFHKAAQVLRDCGFSHYNVFRNRTPEFLKLDF